MVRLKEHFAVAVSVLTLVSGLVVGGITWGRTSGRVDQVERRVAEREAKVDARLARLSARLDTQRDQLSGRLDSLRDRTHAVETNTAVSAESRRAMNDRLEEMIDALRSLSRTRGRPGGL